MASLDLKKYYSEDVIEAGCDEAGRGCIAGPVYAAAVIFPKDINIPELNDSKQLSEKKRYKLRSEIQEKALHWSVAWVDNQRIDQVNILNAAHEAMHKAFDQLAVGPEHLIIDGNRFKPYKNIPHTCIVKGDSQYLSIAAASVLAKTYRDDHMLKLHKEYAMYGWNQNKGYATYKHRLSVLQQGISPYHRRSFNLDAIQLKLDF